jgi:adenylate cyclase
MRRVTGTRIGLAAGIVFGLLRLAAPMPLEVLDLKLLDLRYGMRGRITPGDDVVLVCIDEQSLREVGRWPWSRATLAELVDRLTEAGARVIGFDMIFDQPDPSVDWEALFNRLPPTASSSELAAALRAHDSDARLATALRRSDRVILGHFFEWDLPGNAGVPDARTARFPELSVRRASESDMEALHEATTFRGNLPVLAEAAVSAGHLNFSPDPDGGYRRLPLAIRMGDRFAPAWSLELVSRYLDAPPANVHMAEFGVVSVQVGQHGIPVDEAGELWVNYLGPPGTFPHVAAGDVLHGRLQPGLLQDKIALVGFTASGFDKVATPFSPVAAGVELHATAIDNILYDRALQRPVWLGPVEAAVLVLLGLALGALLGRVRGTAGAVVAAAVGLGYAWLTQVIFSSGFVLSLLYPFGVIVFSTVGVTLFHYVAEEREKRKVRDAFRHYLNPEVTELLAREPERLRLGGERRDITVLFADIRGFTTFSEHLSPEELGELLNVYLGEMTQIVLRNNGLLDKYIGDAVMAFWGAPIAVPDHAERCCRAALQMLAGGARLQTRLAERGWPAVQCVIGISSGDAVVGNFGAADRFSYTALGDTVNLGSRLEGLNKVYGTRILVADQTRTALGEEFICREVDWVAVKGRAQPVAVHELMGLRSADHDGSLRALADAFGSALGAYRTRRWDDALARLGALAAEHPDDGPIVTYLQRCKILRAEPPDDAWDGVFRATSK